jgi:hypothetical protein
VPWGQFSQPTMKEIAARQLSRIAERDQDGAQKFGRQAGHRQSSQSAELLVKLSPQTIADQTVQAVSFSVMV